MPASAAAPSWPRPARAGRGHRDAVDGQARKIGVELPASPAVLHLGPGDVVCGNGPDLLLSLPAGGGLWCLALVNGTTRDAPGAALVFPPGTLGEKVDRLPPLRDVPRKSPAPPRAPSAGGPCCKRPASRAVWRRHQQPDCPPAAPCVHRTSCSQMSGTPPQPCLAVALLGLARTLCSPACHGRWGGAARRRR